VKWAHYTGDRLSGRLHKHQLIIIT